MLLRVENFAYYVKTLIQNVRVSNVNQGDSEVFFAMVQQDDIHSAKCSYCVQNQDCS